MDKIKAFLTAKMQSGEEPALTPNAIQSLDNSLYTDDEQLAIPPIIINNISEQTLKELWELHSRE